MALIPRNERTCFEILDTPYSDNFTVINGLGVIETEVSIEAQVRAKTKIQAKMATFNSDDEAAVNPICVEWQSIEFSTGSIANGSISSITGITYSFDDKRALLRNKLLYYLPFYRQHEREQREMGAVNNGSGNGSGGGGYIPFIR